MKYIPMWFLFLTACVFAGCKKTITTTNYVLSPDALAYIQFTPGKYFIYKDSAANNNDSITVTQSLLSPYNGTTLNVPYVGQQYMLVLSQINPGGTNTVWLSGTAPGFLMTRVQLISNDNPDNLLFQDIATNVPNMVINGKSYTNVNLTTNEQGTVNTTGYFKTAYYWAKGVGLIKRMETIGLVKKSYSLLRNN